MHGILDIYGISARPVSGNIGDSKEKGSSQRVFFCALAVSDGDPGGNMASAMPTSVKRKQPP